MRKITTLSDANDMIVSTGAMLPNRLADEIGYSQDKQTNIKLAFERIRSCCPLMEKKVKEASVMQKLDLDLQKSQTASEAGEDKAARRDFIMVEATPFPGNDRGAVIPPDWDW